MRIYIRCLMIITMVLGITEISSADITSNLVAYYPFNGNANDESGNDNNGIVTAATLATDRHDNPNMAYVFDSAPGAINITNTSDIRFGSGDFTISAWVKHDSLPTDHSAIYAKYDGIPRSMISINSSGYAWFTIRDINYNQETATGTSQVTGGAWHHIVGIREGYSIYLYIDGKLEDEDFMANMGSIDGNCTYSRVGGNNTSSGHCISTNMLENNFVGKIDQIRLYNRALSTCDVMELFVEELHGY